MYFYYLKTYWAIGGGVAAIALMMWSYFRNLTRQKRQQLHILAAGVVLALAGFISTSLLPDAIFGTVFDYDISLLFLLLIPLAYAYAILEHRLINISRYVSPATALLVVLFFLVSLYSGFYVTISNLFGEATSQPLVIMAYTVFCGVISIMVYRVATRIVNRVFYGSWYDYQKAVKDISTSLPLNHLEELSFARQVIREIETVMHFEYVDILLPGEANSWQTVIEKDDFQRLIFFRPQSLWLT